MIAVSIEAGPRNLQNLANLEREAAKFGLSLRDISAHQSALYASGLMKYTPPFRTPGKPDEKVGRKAIRNDLMKISKILGADEFEEGWLVTGGQVDQAWKTKKGVVYGTERTNWVRTPSQLAPIHQAARSKATGRVSDAGQFTKNIGRWKFVNRAVMTGDTFGKYLDILYAKIGSLASGWLPAANYFRSRSRVPVKWNIPAFIMRHSGSGNYVDQMNQNGDGYMKGTMIMRFGGATRFNNLYEFQRKLRERDMSGWIIKRLEKMARDMRVAGRAAA